MAVRPSDQLCLLAAREITSAEDPPRITGTPPGEFKELLLLAEEVDERVRTMTTAATAIKATPPKMAPKMIPRLALEEGGELEVGED